MDGQAHALGAVSRAEMKLIVGLGNPGRKYDGTRHNVGFAVLEELARRHKLTGRRLRFEGELAETTIAEHRVLLLAPQTLMNASGRCVRQAINYYKIPLQDVVVVCDDLNLPFGKLRIRARGSSGGHKGLASLIADLGTEHFSRVRIGIGRREDGEVSDFVLSRFRREERPVVDEAIAGAADALELWLAEGVDACMNRFN